MHVRRTIFASLLGLSLCTGLVACNKRSDVQAATTAPSASNTIAASADGKSQTVSNSEGFAVQVPGDWKERKPDQPHVVMMMVQPHPATGELTDMMIVTVVPLPHPDHPPTIEDEVAADKRVVDRNHPETEYGPIENSTIDSSGDARIFWLKYNLNQKPARSHRMIVLHDGKCYMALFTCDQSRGEESDQQFKSILSTWKWQ